jgi:Kdo2-lipid IVA lauroyltransferase/acyltransferase
VLDLGRAWWATDAQLAGLMTIEGIQYIRAAQQSGRPVILLSAHYMNLEMAGRLIAAQVRLSTVYRAHENEVVNYYMVRNRAARFEQIIERDDIRLLVSLLKQGKVIWYAGDQDMGRKQSLFADFFGHPAATVTALSRLAKMSDAQVIPMSFYRESETYKHRIVFEAPLENFPSDDLLRDVSVHNHCIEQAIRRQPENYLWAHRRFKTRPEGEPPWYPKKQRRRKGRAA